MKKILFLLLFSFSVFSCMFAPSSEFNAQIRKDFPEAILYNAKSQMGGILVVTKDSTFLVQLENCTDSGYVYTTERLELVDSVVTSLYKEDTVKSEPTTFTW